jgi:hypothetical protein
MRIRRVLPMICMLSACPGIGIAGNTLWVVRFVDFQNRPPKRGITEADRASTCICRQKNIEIA